MTALCKFAVVSVAAVACLSAGGCASRGPDVPAGAELVAEGNERIVYQVPRDGMIYVFDDDANRHIYTGRVARGQTLTLDSKEDDVLVDGRSITEWDLDPDHRLQVYFDDRSAIGGRADAEGERASYRGTRGTRDERDTRDYRDTRNDPVERRHGSWNP